MKNAFLSTSVLMVSLLFPRPVEAKLDTINAVTTVSIIGSFIYGIHWFGFKCLYNRAQARYELPLAVVAAYADNPGDHAALYYELLGLINVDNATWSSPTSRYHNYPLVEFVVDLDFYIQKLSRGSWFTLPTKLSSDADQLKTQLQRLRYYCIRHAAYIEQRRTADQWALHHPVA